MLIRVNGETQNVPEGATLLTLLGQLGLQGQLVAIEKNKSVVPRAEHACTSVGEGDEIEIVHFVGGG